MKANIENNFFNLFKDKQIIQNFLNNQLKNFDELFVSLKIKKEKKIEKIEKKLKNLKILKLKI